MFKKIFVTLGLMSLVASGLLACEPRGCTPGFWKTGNHVQGFQTERYVDVFELGGTAALTVNAMVNDVNVKKAYDKLPGMTEDVFLELGEALWLEGNKGKVGEDKFLQLVRTSTAALLNIRHVGHYYYGVSGTNSWTGFMEEGELIELVQGAFAGTVDAAQLQHDLDINNNSVCPEGSSFR